MTLRSSDTVREPIVAAPHLGRRAIVLGVATTLLAPTAWAHPVRYLFDQTAGVIEFTVRHIGLLSSTGRFGRFNAEVRLDSTDATQAAVDVTVETSSIVVAWPGAEDLLRSPAYFDSTHFPTAHFHGSTAGYGGPERFALRGDLSLRGVTRVFDMQGQLQGRRFSPALQAEVAEFTAGGTLRRSEFGMTADSIMTGDNVRIDVRVAIQLTDPAHNG